jgi:hypothetical protein
MAQTGVAKEISIMTRNMSSTDIVTDKDLILLLFLELSLILVTFLSIDVVVVALFVKDEEPP